MSEKPGEIRREEIPGETTKTGAPKEKFGTGAAAQSLAGQKGGEIAKEQGLGVMADPAKYGHEGGKAKKAGMEEEEKTTE